MVAFTVLLDCWNHFKLNNSGPWTATKLLSYIKSWILSILIHPEHFGAFMTLAAPLLTNTTVIFKFWSSWLSSCTITSICIADLWASPAFPELILITHAFLESHSGPFYICATHPVFLLVTELFYFVLALLPMTGKALWLWENVCPMKRNKKTSGYFCFEMHLKWHEFIFMFCSSETCVICVAIRGDKCLIIM